MVPDIARVVDSLRSLTLSFKAFVVPTGNCASDYATFSS
jgi:hypothetical protein